MGERRRAHGRGPQHSSNWGGARPRKKAEPQDAQVEKSNLTPEGKKAQTPIELANALSRLAEAMQQVRENRVQNARNPFAVENLHPPAAIPPKGSGLRIAMDQSLEWSNQQWTTLNYAAGLAGEGLAFLGYPYLSELAQRPEYRTFAEIIATECTRKWIEIKSVGAEKEVDEDGDPEDEQDPVEELDPDVAAEDRAPQPGEKGATLSGPEAGGEEDDEDEETTTEADKAQAEKDAKAEKIKQLVEFLDDLKVRDCFAQITRDDAFFGRSHLFLEIGDVNDKSFAAPGVQDPELATSIGNGRDDVTIAKIEKGRGLRRLKVIEAVWVYPTTYNAANPLAPDWYNPQVWYVMGTQIHHTRLLTFVGRPVPDMLKPAYSFGGLSLSQMVKPYVDIWLTTRQSVADLIHSFSTMVLQTDMQAMLQPGGAAIAMARALLFNTLRDNNGLFVTDKNTEDFKNVSAPISGLEGLQGQAQEHMMSVARIPAVKFTGMQPQGLNASSEGEIRAFYDTIAAYQNAFMRPHLTTVIDIAQITLWGAIDPDIVFEFVPLWEPTAKEEADLKKADADRDTGYIDAGVLAPEEVRRKLASDPKSGYDDIDPDDVPEPPEPEGGDPFGGEGGGDPSGGDEPDPLFAEDGALAQDAWSEQDHPRGQPGNAGQFGSGGGGSSSKGGKASSASAGSSSGKGGSTSQKMRMPQYGLTPTPRESHQHEDPDGSEYFKKNWHKSNSVGGHAQPSSKQVSAYTNAYESQVPLDPAKLKRVGAQMGSNPGGVFETPSGQKFYVKKGKSPAHVKNEVLAASLYGLAGAQTLNYRAVAGGSHIATAMEKLDKDRADKLSPEERKAAQADFAVHAWLGNWDAVGTGGDNLGTIGGVPTALDLGGALEYRAQGAPKGAAFGTKVGEIDTMRDSAKSPDSAKMFGEMDKRAIAKSVKKVTSIPDEKIIDTVQAAGLPTSLAAKLIARKQDLATRFGGANDSSPFAEDEFNESDHPRAPDGKWTSGGGGGGGGGGSKAQALKVAQYVAQKGGDLQELMKTLTNAEWDEVKDLYGNAANLLAAGAKLNKAEGVEKTTPPQKAEAEAEGTGSYGGLYIKTGASAKENHALTVSKVVNEDAKMGIHYRRMVAQLLKEASGFGTSDATKGILTKRLGEAWGMAYKKAVATNNQKDITAIQAKLKQLGIMTTSMAAPAAPKTAFAAAAEADIAKLPPKKAGFLQGLKDAIVGVAAPAKSQKETDLENVKKFSPKFFAKAQEIDKQKAAGTINTLNAAKEKIKAAVQSGDATVEAAKVMLTDAETNELNLQYGSVENTYVKATQYHAQKAKSAAESAAAAKQLKEAQEAQKQAAAKAAAAQKAKEAEEAKANAAKNATVMKELGITAKEAEGFNALVGMLGGKQSDVVSSFKDYEKTAEKYGYPITGFQAALISNYSDGGYGAINQSLRKGSWTTAQHVYVKMVNRALAKMPSHKGTVNRGTELTKEQQLRYSQAGHVVREDAFMSTSTGSGFGGNTRFHIEAKGKRGASIQKLSNYQGESEVLFRANTYFKVNKVQGQPGGQMTVWMEEWDEDDDEGR